MSSEDKETSDSNDFKNESRHLMDNDSSTTSNMSPSSWNTPVSSVKSEERGTPSSVSWNTPKSFKSSDEHTESIPETDGNDNIAHYSHTESHVMIPNDNPPPYPGTEQQNTWTLMRQIQDGLRDSMRNSDGSNVPELANSIENANSPLISNCTEDPPERTRTASCQKKLFRNYDEFSEGVKGRETFANKYGTVCIIALFVIFLMILSLIAKFLVKKTLRL